MAPKILLQLDTDAQPSTFDSVVAIDAGAEHLLRHGGITVENVTSLVHGAMFTRGGDNLKRTAIFIGGSDVNAAEKVSTAVEKCFFGPVRVSVLQDASGCNTTAAAAVLSAAKHIDFGTGSTCVLGGTGPVGKRVAEMIAIQGGRVTLVSRSQSRADEAASAINERLGSNHVIGAAASDMTAISKFLIHCQAIIACGAEGVQLLDAATLAKSTSVKVAIDLNAVPPAGIEAINAIDKAKEANGMVLYGALGVGGLKMKIHKAAIAALFERNDAMLDAKEVLAIGKELLASSK